MRLLLKWLNYYRTVIWKMRTSRLDLFWASRSEQSSSSSFSLGIIELKKLQHFKSKTAKNLSARRVLVDLQFQLGYAGHSSNQSVNFTEPFSRSVGSAAMWWSHALDIIMNVAPGWRRWFRWFAGQFWSRFNSFTADTSSAKKSRSGYDSEEAPWVKQDSNLRVPAITLQWNAKARALLQRDNPWPLSSRMRALRTIFFCFGCSFFACHFS